VAGGYNRTSITITRTLPAPILSAAALWPPGVWMTAVATCRTCGTEPRAGARFCDACGAPAASQPPAEYKQVTVLFADVVGSMDIAAAVGSERLREIMADLLDRSSAVVKRYGGTVNQFTGDGIMAVFGAPITLEDHAFRACLAALDIHKDVAAIAAEVERRDAIALNLRVGLNSGQVIAGEIGSSTASYTTIGKQVGMAQRMESVAPPGGVMLSESTARLVEDAAVLGDSELVHIKGAATPVPARRLLAIGDHQPRRRNESALVGRTWELNTITGILDEAVGGAGCVVNVMGPPGIGKSRLVRETTAIAASRSVPTFSTYCESHASNIPFHAIARLLRAGTGIDHLEADAARSSVRDRFPDADPEDLLLLDDLLGIGATEALPDIAPDARRRRLTALINAAALTQDPAVYVIEDVHWIDEASESMLADFLAVIPQIPALVLITYRPEYRGTLSRMPDAQAVALRPLNSAQTSALTTQLLGTDPSLGELATQVSARAAGNPFFAEEIVRDLAERGVVHGRFGAYRLRGDVSDASVPATLQATIGSRIDRMNAAAKNTLNAAAVIGSRFDAELVSALAGTVDIAPLIQAQLVEQVRFTPRAEYAFRHPLIRTVAYGSQLKSDRARLHRRLAADMQARGSVDENTALIAEHLEAAGDLHAAFEWHMRAGAWLAFRDIPAAQTSWRRARQVADQLPEDEPDRPSMRIAPRTFLCATAFRGGSGVETGFDELRDLCTAAGDQRSLAIGLAGLVVAQAMTARRREGSQLATELVRLLETIGDPILTVGLSWTAMVTKLETGEMTEVLRLAQRAIDLADGDATKGNLLIESPLAFATYMRGSARCCVGTPGWKDDCRQAIAMSRALTGDPTMLAGAVWYAYVVSISNGARLPDATSLRDTAETLAIAEQSADEIALLLARLTRGITLIYDDGPERDTGLDLIAKVRDRAVKVGLIPLAIADIHVAREKARLGQFEGAIELAETVLDNFFSSGGSMWSSLATSVLVEALLQRGCKGDLKAAQAAIDRLAAAPTDPGFVVSKIWLLRMRALLARAHGDDAVYRSHRDRYRKMANELGFEGHMAWAEAMP
jgi:adenylate cyclase